jgi:hypothetical protein
MSTVRIQVRRGTASEWTSVNPTLAAGELGVETDTRKIKVGTGSTAWTSLSYIASDAPGITEIAQDAIDQALSMGSGLTKSYNDNGNTISLGIDDSVVALKSYVDSQVGGLQNTVTSDYVLLADVGNAGGPAKLDADGNLLVPKSSIIIEGSAANDYETTITVVNPTADRTITLPDVSGTVALTSNLEPYATTVALNSVISALNIHKAAHVATTSALAATYAAGTADLGGGTGIGATLTMNSNGTLTIDGVLLVEGFRVVVKDQANNIHNGIYEVTNAGSGSTAVVLTRAGDYNNSNEQLPLDVEQGDVVYVMSGTENGFKQFSQIYTGTNTDGSVKIGTDAIDFTQISGTSSFEVGNGIIKTGNTISADTSYVLTTAAASSTYLSQASAGSTYLTISSAGSTYLTTATATADYLRQDTAASTYLTTAAAATNYFATSTDQIADANIKTDAAIQPSKILGTAITAADTGTVTNTMLAGSIANNKLTNSTISGKALGENLSELTIGTGLTGTSYNGGSAVTIAIDSTVATESYADTAASNAQGAAEDYADGLAANYEVAGAVSTHSSDTTNVHGITDTAQIALLNAATQQFTGDMGITGDLIVDGDVTVNGGSFAASATSITIEDNMVQLAHQNAANTVDLGLVVGYSESSTAKHAGIVRDVSSDKWKLFKGVTTEPSTTVDFTQGSLDDLELNNITAAGVVFSDGTQTKEGVPSRTPIISKTANYTLSAASERDSLIEVDSTDPVTITIPTNSAVAYPVGTTLDILGINTGLITIAGDTGVTVNATPGLKLRTQWSSATLFKRAENSWVVYGDLKS